MKPAQYIFVNKELGMSTGKTAAQVAHASCLSLEYHLMLRDRGFRGTALDSRRIMILDHWWSDGHYAKYVMQCDDHEQLMNVERYLNDRGYKTFLVIDEGHTEDTVFRATALGVELVDKDDGRTASIFKEFRLYKDPFKIKWIG